MMNTVIKFRDSLDEFRNIVMLYRDENGQLFVGNTFSTSGKNHTRDWMSALHKEPVPDYSGTGPFTRLRVTFFSLKS